MPPASLHSLQLDLDARPAFPKSRWRSPYAPSKFPSSPLGASPSFQVWCLLLDRSIGLTFSASSSGRESPFESILVFGTLTRCCMCSGVRAFFISRRFPFTSRKSSFVQVYRNLVCLATIVLNYSNTSGNISCGMTPCSNCSLKA